MNDENPYESPKGAEKATGGPFSLWLWGGAACSLACSVSSLVFFYLYGYWHWHDGPWQQTLPGQFGFSWIFAVDGSKTLSMILAIASLAITIAIFRNKGYVQGIVTLPTCLLSLLTVGVVT